jgi:GDP-D-mannose 3', 5'-epimerase
VSKRILVCGAGGFIAGHLIHSLAAEGNWIRAVDRTERPYGPVPADDWLLADLRDPHQCALALAGGFDEVYQLAADMGGMEFISSAECEIMRNNVSVNVNMIEAAVRVEVDRYFYSSSVCIYRDMAVGEPPLCEEDAYPAQPDNEYGWEKLYSERVIHAYARRFGIEARIGRFQNCYGPYGAWRGGREKAPAALCRKVANAPDGGVVEVFGGGSTSRQFVYVDDLVNAVTTLTRSDESRPTNIGVDESVTIVELVETIADVAGKDITIHAIDGPLGVESRNFSHKRIQSLGWVPRHTLRQGIAKTYPWIEQQVLEAADPSIA